MKQILSTLIILAILMIPLSSSLAETAPAVEQQEVATPLYLHVFTPNPDGSNETLHLITIRFSPGERFEVFTKWSFEGHIEAKKEKFMADLNFSFNGGTFNGEVELEKRYEAMPIMVSSVIRMTSFAITHNKDPKEFTDLPYFAKEPETTDK